MTAHKAAISETPNLQQQTDVQTLICQTVVSYVVVLEANVV